VPPIAVNIIGQAFEASLDSQTHALLLTDKFLFMQPQRTYKGNKARELYYAKMVERHIVHTEAVVAEISYGVKVDLDQSFDMSVYARDSYFEGSASLRDILLDLKVETIGNPMYGCNLFHSVDYFQESNNLWINSQKCDGSTCCVFTYYQANHIEASTMMKGMGKMIVKEFGSELAGLMFNINHFKGNQGYRWSKTLRKFSTPEKRRMKANQAFDHNLPVIKILLQQKKDLEAKEAEGKTKKDKEERNKNKKKKNYKKQNIDDATNRNNTMTSIDIVSIDGDGNINNNNNEEGVNERKEIELVDEV
jgi:hypothetical protein